MVVGLVKSGNGKPIVKFVFEDCIRQEISADANVATFMVDWRVSICWIGEAGCLGVVLCGSDGCAVCVFVQQSCALKFILWA